MSRLILKAVFSLLPMLVSAMVVIRAQPYEDRQLRMLLMPENCAPPCFLGIRPGFTNVMEAVNLLENHAWVANVEPHYIGSGTSSTHLRGWVYWDWKTDAPIWFRTTPDVLRGHAGAFEMLDNIVQSVTVATNVPFGNLRLTMGKPSGYGLSFSDVVIKKGVFTSASLRYRDAYLDSNIQAEGISLCRDVWNLWFVPSIITFFGDQQIPQRRSRFMGNLPFLSQIHALRREVCYGLR